MLSSSPYPDPSAPNIDMLLEKAQKWKESFNKPLPLGVKKAVSIVTCMVGETVPKCLPFSLLMKHLLPSDAQIYVSRNLWDT